jgi:hypothetical protein
VSARTIRFRKRLKLKTVNDALTLTFPRSTAIESLEWRMDVDGSSVPMIEFPHSQVRGGVSVGINNGRRVLVQHAFVATMKSGHEGIFVRHGLPRHRNKAGFDLPIKELYTTRVADVFDDSGMIDAVTGQAMRKFDETFDRVFPGEVDKIRARGV